LPDANFLVLDLYFKFWIYYRSRDERLSSVLDESLTMFCSLKGDVFENEEVQFGYLFTLITTVMKIIVGYVLMSE
jgi:hypothetical protein